MKSYIANLIGISIITASLKIYGLPGFVVSTIIVGTILYIIHKASNDE